MSAMTSSSQATRPIVSGVRRVSSSGGVEFEAFDLAHDSAMALPSQPGLILGSDESDGSWILVRDVRRWVVTNRAELLASAPSSRPLIWWSGPRGAQLEILYQTARGERAALRQARPTRMSEVRLAPQAWGLYRIHQGTGAWYVGISTNLRNRLYAHQAHGRLNFARGDTVDLIQAKQPGLGGVVTWADLQQAERDHIARLRQRGERLVNVVSGGNGNPPAVRFNAGSRAVLDRLAARRALPAFRTFTVGQVGPGDTIVDGRPVQVADIRARLSSRVGEWSLSLALEDDGPQVWAQPYLAEMSTAFRHDTIDLDRLRNLSASQGEQALLVATLREAGVADGSAVNIPLVYWRPTRGRINDKLRGMVPAQALLEMTQEHVREATLPPVVREAGYEIDMSFLKGSSLNPVRRVRGPDGSHIYVKIEENDAGSRAELLASLLWYRLGWSGIVDRVIESYDRSVLIVPPVAGVRSIEDRGPVARCFDVYPREHPESLLVGDRSRHVVRIGIDDLRLRDPYDVIRFVIVNAAWGNSDRHAGNLHYGWEADEDSAAGGYGYLLPIDHGRCFFNNAPWLGSGRIHGGPEHAVTGRLSNPHQLLRAFAEIAAAEPEAALYVATDWCTVLADVIEALCRDPEWAEFRGELLSVRSRVDQISEDVQGFLDTCGKVVVR